MAESIGIGESVTVEVTRANAVNFPTISAQPLAATETVIIFVGVIIGLGLVALAVRRYMRQTGAVSGPSRRGDVLRSLGVAALVGFVGFLLSASPLSWVLSAGVFYHQLFVRSKRN